MAGRGRRCALDVQSPLYFDTLFVYGQRGLIKTPFLQFNAYNLLKIQQKIPLHDFTSGVKGITVLYDSTTLTYYWAPPVISRI